MARGEAGHENRKPVAKFSTMVAAVQTLQSQNFLETGYRSPQKQKPMVIFLMPMALLLVEDFYFDCTNHRKISS